MSQQRSKNINSSILPARSEVVENPVFECVCAKKGDDAIQKTNTGTSLHTIRKIIKKNSVEYFCNECNAHYSQLNWLKEKHPGINVAKFNICDLRKGMGIYS